MPTTLSVLGVPIGQAGPTVQRLFQMTLYLSDGLTLAANKSGLFWAWWPTVAAMRTQLPDAQGTGASTDSNGIFTQNAPNVLSAGADQGFGVISDQDATPDAAEVAYIGTFVVI